MVFWDMHIDGGVLKALRDSIAFGDGRPPWEVVAALHAFGVSPGSDIAAVRTDGQVRVLARVGRSVVVVTAHSNVSAWWRDVGERPRDFTIEARSVPLTAVGSVVLHQIDHEWMSYGSLTKLHGVWLLSIEGWADPIQIPAHGDDEELDFTPFIQRLIAVETKSD
jgi:hypothetical protein